MGRKEARRGAAAGRRDAADGTGRGRVPGFAAGVLVALLALMAALAAVTAAAAAAGYARAEFVPAVYIAGSNTPLGAAGLIAWAVLLLLPTILHLWEDMTWRILRSKI